MKNNNKGFTFVELMVVIAIASIMFAIATVSFRDITKNSRDARRKSDMESIKQALELCRSYSGSYPAAITAGAAITCSSGGTPQTFMSKVPYDPKDGVSTYTYTPVLSGAIYITYTLMTSSLETVNPPECVALTNGKCTYTISNP